MYSVERTISSCIRVVCNGLVASLLLTATSVFSANADTTVHQLSKEVIPHKYTLSFEPDFNDFTFTGTEKINLTVHSETQNITLNAIELNITKATLISNSSTQSARIAYDTNSQQVTLHFQLPVKPGEYSLDCSFTGSLNDQLRGFYRSSYGKKKTHWLATTQMEPTDARRMFPCFDEPDFKATYLITAVIDPRFVAISNSPILDEKISNGKKIVAFEETPLMSTYLVALIVGDLKRTGTKTDKNGVPISVWTIPGKERLGKIALDIASEILPIQTTYFGIPYPGRKLDLIAIPDFSAGAMENLGAITFRDDLLLFDEKTGTTSQKQTIASLEAHEIAHQWFGDLVTMKWWDDLWLNEAFATWMATRTIETLYPSWRFLEKAINDYDEAEDEDQLQTTRAIHAAVLNPAQAREMFDTITYEKGAALLRMLECFVGEGIFQKGVHNYLVKHARGNATTHDLWTEISHATGNKIPVNTIMNSWVYQPGLPLVKASLQGDGKSMQLQQTRFFGIAEAKATNQRWQIPVVFKTLIKHDKTGANKTAESERLLFSESKRVKIFQTPYKSIFLNKDGVGFYRVQYTQHDFNLIEKHFSILSPEEKLVFLSDTTALATAGKIPVENALNLMLNIKKETDPLVQQALVQAFNLPIPSINSDSKNDFERLIQSNLRPLKQQLGWWAKDGESVLNIDLREAVMIMLGTYGQDQPTIDEAFKLFHQYLYSQRSVNQDIVPAILRIVAFNGGEQEYQTIVEKWKSSKNPEDEKRFLMTLARFNQPSLITKTLNLSLTPEVRGQDRSSMLDIMLKRKESQNQAWLFITTHWTEILACFPEVELSDIPTSCDSFYTRAAEQSLQSFFAKHTIPYAISAVARALEEVHINVLFQEKNAEKIRAWIKAYVKRHPEQTTSSRTQ